MDPRLVRAEVREAVAWLTLDSPPVNALSVALIGALEAALAAQ